MSGYSYHDARKNNPLDDSTVTMNIDGEEITWKKTSKRGLTSIYSNIIIVVSL